MITAKEIKPEKNGHSDFFSWQLYRWAKKRPHAMRIWSGTWNNINGVDENNRVLYIGYERDGQWIYARQLRNLCVTRARLDCYAYYGAHDTEKWIDVTEQFWSDYMKIGVCAIHGDYAHNWNVTGDARHCNYCGKTEKKVMILTEKTIWIAAHPRKTEA